MRITEARAVLFESPDPVTPTPPDGALDVVMLLDRHRIPWRTLPHRPTALTASRAASSCWLMKAVEIMSLRRLSWLTSLAPGS